MDLSLGVRADLFDADIGTGPDLEACIDVLHAKLLTVLALLQVIKRQVGTWPDLSWSRLLQMHLFWCNVDAAVEAPKTGQ